MDIKTYRAKTMRDALEQVRRELGPSAAVLHTREVNSGPLSRLVFGRKYEVAASAAVNVPSRLPAAYAGAEVGGFEAMVGGDERTLPQPLPMTEGSLDDYRARYRNDFKR